VAIIASALELFIITTPSTSLSGVENRKDFLHRIFDANQSGHTSAPSNCAKDRWKILYATSRGYSVAVPQERQEIPSFSPFLTDKP
jgi:hypothetical protein